jgi:hypothetical protein
MARNRRSRSRKRAEGGQRCYPWIDALDLPLDVEMDVRRAHPVAAHRQVGAA